MKPKAILNPLINNKVMKMKKVTKAVLARMNSNVIDTVKSEGEKEKGGFTLIEIMIVVAIIAILSAIAIPTYQGLLERSKINKEAYQQGIIDRAQDFNGATGLDVMDTGDSFTNALTTEAEAQALFDTLGE